MLGKPANITKQTFTLFSKPSKFMNEYAIASDFAITKYIPLPKPWFRAVNGIGAGTDSLINIFGVDN